MERPRAPIYLDRDAEAYRPPPGPAVAATRQPERAGLPSAGPLPH